MGEQLQRRPDRARVECGEQQRAGAVRKRAGGRGVGEIDLHAQAWRGTAAIGVVVRDSGGAGNGGGDTSVVRAFTITVSGNYSIYIPLVVR